VLGGTDLRAATELHTTSQHNAWASALSGKWGQLTPLEKMDEKLKSKNMQKRAFFYVYVIL